MGWVVQINMFFFFFIIGMKWKNNMVLCLINEYRTHEYLWNHCLTSTDGQTDCSIQHHGNKWISYSAYVPHGRFRSVVRLAFKFCKRSRPKIEILNGNGYPMDSSMGKGHNWDYYSVRCRRRHTDPIRGTAQANFLGKGQYKTNLTRLLKPILEQRGIKMLQYAGDANALATQTALRIA